MTTSDEGGLPDPPRLTPQGQQAMVALELREVGYRKADDLTVFASTYSSRELRAAVPILMRWLPLMRWPVHREALVWGLAGPHGRPAAQLLIEQYQRDGHHTVRHAISNVLERIASPELAPFLADLVALADDHSVPSRDRLGIAAAIGKLRTPEALDAAKARFADSEIGPWALRGYTNGRGRLTEAELVALERMHGDRETARLVARHRKKNAPSDR